MDHLVTLLRLRKHYEQARGRFCMITSDGRQPAEYWEYDEKVGEMEALIKGFKPAEVEYAEVRVKQFELEVLDLDPDTAQFFVEKVKRLKEKADAMLALL